jgi:hypothetical protein
MEATCLQMVVDAFANELENQGVSPKVARDIAVKSYLSEPKAFSPKGAVKGIHAPMSIVTNLSNRFYESQL